MNLKPNIDYNERMWYLPMILTECAHCTFDLSGSTYYFTGYYRKDNYRRVSVEASSLDELTGNIIEGMYGYIPDGV